MRIVDAHTHLSGPDSGESAAGILECMDANDVEKAFIIAPLLDVRSFHLTDANLDDIRAHNNYCAAICSAAPDRLLALSVLNPAPALANGSADRAADLMIAEAERVYRELGLRGVKLVPAGWYPYDPPVVRLYNALRDLGMYVLFHVGIFADGLEGRFCRPAFYEAVHEVPGLRAQLAHAGWPWVDECIAVLEMERQIHGDDPSAWQLRVDLSFGPPSDWQLSSWQHAIDALPPGMLCYGSDVFWPCTAERYREQYLRPQLGLFEVAANQSHLVPEGDPKRASVREQIFYQNAWDHWRAGASNPQQPRRVEGSSSDPTTRRSGVMNLWPQG